MAIRGKWAIRVLTQPTEITEITPVDFNRYWLRPEVSVLADLSFALNLVEFSRIIAPHSTPPVLADE